jgi:hypothetical protein
MMHTGPRAPAQCHLATSSSASAQEPAPLGIVTAQEVTATINALQKLVKDVVGSDQYLLKAINDGVSAVINRVQEKIIERNIARKGKGGKFVSSIGHTKHKQNKESVKSSEKKASYPSAFPGRGNSSPIGAISKANNIVCAKKQSHPGTNKHKSKSDMKFCDDCGVYVTGMCTHAVCSGLCSLAFRFGATSNKDHFAPRFRGKREEIC